MAWRTPTENDLLSSISSAELTAYRAAAISDTQTDPVTSKLSAAVNFVRGYISANQNNSLGDDDTLPEALIGPTMDYLAVDVIKRIPGRRIDDARDDARKAAITLFGQVARGNYAIEAPATGADPSETVNTPSPQITEQTNNFTDNNQSGI